MHTDRKRNNIHNKIEPLSYMTACRVISQVLILYAIFPTFLQWAQVYIVFLGMVFLLSNFILWKGNELLCTDYHKRLFLWIETGFILVLLPVAPFGAYFGLFVVQLVTACISFEKAWERNSYALLFFLLGMLFTYYHFATTDHLKEVILIVLFSYIFGFFSANAIRKLEAQKRELGLLNTKLEVYAAKVEELTITEERNRLAREMHDTVAHRSTALIMQLQAAKSLSSTKKIDQVEEIIDKCLEVSRHMLDEMRRSVRALNPTESENLISFSSIQKLTKDFSEQTNMNIQLHEFGVNQRLKEESQVAIYRAIQEGLTNAKRHGKATDVKVVLKYMVDRLQLEIEDNGKGCENIEYGFGLAGMKDRLSKLKGKLNIESTKMEDLD